MGTPDPKVDSIEHSMVAVFGNYKAEWLKDRLFDFFQRPHYLSELESPTPVILQGGRGTGKTTVLRCMEYRGKYSTQKLNPSALDQMPYWGVYYRVDTSRVNAFSGQDVKDWTRLFSHYFNLLLVEKMLRMATWTEQTQDRELPVRNPGKIVATLAAPTDLNSWTALHAFAERALSDLELYVNNIGKYPEPVLTMPRAPIEAIANSLHETLPFKGRPIFILIDEFENLQDYQQKIVNTYIKHAEAPLSYKVGVRPAGRRIRYTQNHDEILESPADFSLVDVSVSIVKEFPEFARKICEERLASVSSDEPAALTTLNDLLPKLGSEEEAIRLGGEGIAKSVRQALSGTVPQEWLDTLRVLDLILLDYWSKKDGKTLVEIAETWQQDPAPWGRRLANFTMPLLFYINAGRRGGVLRKYYCGVEVYLTLASNNIRYCLELVNRAIVLHVRDGKNLRDPVSPHTQTIAAREVGKKNLAEMEGLSRFGGRIKKLVLSLGRILQVMAHNPLGHTPDVTCFVLSGAFEHNESQAGDVLTEAWSRLAMLKFPASKPETVGDTRGDEYMLHPILAPYFEISYMRKRNITLSPDDIELLMSTPKPAISRILSAQGRSDDDPLPDQMKLFGAFYESSGND